MLSGETRSHSGLCRRSQNCRLRYISRERASLQQMIEQARGALLDRFYRAVNKEIGRERRFVRIRDASEVFDLAGERLLVKPFDIAFDEHRKRRTHEDFNKLGAVAFDRLTNIITRLPVRRDG